MTQDLHKQQLSGRGFGLSARLFLLTALFVLLAEVLIYVPLIATYRRNWLENRVTAAVTAALVLEATPDGMVSEDLSKQLLGSVGARVVRLQVGEARRLLATSDKPARGDVTTDLRTLDTTTMIMQALDTLTASQGRTVKVIGSVPMVEQPIEIVLDERPLRQAMKRYSQRIMVISLIISVITATLLYWVLSVIIVRPIRHLTAAMTRFSADPENPGKAIVPAARRDEIGQAERAFAAMQTDIVTALHSKTHLAALGLAVAKINHDLRNMLATAQLMSDRLTTSSDPIVRQFAPRLIGTLDRAIAFCRETLSYGKAVEPPPQRRPVDLAALVDEVHHLAGVSDDATITWTDTVEPGLTIDADPDQLARALVNLVRNAAEALRTQPDGEPRRIDVSAHRSGGTAIIDIGDNGPGVPPLARDHLFSAFAGSARPGGTGLGLAIAAELVRAHGGRIELIDSAEGAHFRIEMPVRAETQQ